MASSSSTTATTSGGSPCGACKFLRRKCVPDCVFAPYFCSEQGPSVFAAIHKVFGASNLSKLLLHVPVHCRCDAVLTVAYQAQARIRDPVYGCVSHIFALQQQVAYLQTQLMQTKAQVAQTMINSGRNMEINEWTDNLNFSNGIQSFPNDDQTQIMNLSVSPQSSLESVANNDEALFMNLQESQSKFPKPQFQQFSRKIPLSNCHGDVSELQALALRMMRN